MSYEGYSQIICSNGHYYEADCYAYNDPCPVCLAAPAWNNPVDQTNGADEGIIAASDLEQFVKTPAIEKTCDLGHVHTISPTIFNVPTREQTDPFRVFFDEEME